MLTKQNLQLQALYLNLKKDYDCLLEKNQSDLVKIRIKEKTLNEKILQIKRQRQEEVQSLTQQNEQLKIQLSRCKSCVKNQIKQQASQSQLDAIKSLLKKKSNQNKCLVVQIRNKQQIICKLEDKVKSLQDNQIKKTQSLRSEMKKSHQASILQIEQIKSLNMELEQKITSMQQATKAFSSQNQQMKKYLQQSDKQLELRQNRIREQHQQIQYLNKRLAQMSKPCSKCSQLQQQVQLHKQMVKSVRVMLKFKEMELSNLKK